MSAKNPKITLLSFRTFGDYVLKAPFLHELFRIYPGAEVVLLTNEKGGMVYPLLDSRLKIVVVDRGHGKAELALKVLRVPRADVIYSMDDSRTSLILSLLLRGKRKTGWVQGISRLYGDTGYFDWKSVRPWLSSAARTVFRPSRVRLPEEQYEGYVELELLEGERPEPIETGHPLAYYRSAFAQAPAPKPPQPYIYCAAEAGWVARQLTGEQWKGIISGLLDTFPKHSILIHGSGPSVEAFSGHPRVSAFGQKTVQQLFQTISAADLVIAPDSFALHLASLYAVPAIGYFGPAHPHRFRPTGPGSSSLFSPPPCSPCLQRRGTERCRMNLTQCTSLASLTPNDFIAGAELALASHPG